MLIDLANELRQSDVSDNEMQNPNGDDDEFADSDDDDDDDVGDNIVRKYRNDKETVNENDKNDEVDKMLLSHEKK